MQLLDVSAPVGTVYASHSCRSGGCIALRTVGMGLDAVAQWAGMSIKTLIKSYKNALSVPALEAHLFFGRLLPRAPSLPALRPTPSDGYAASPQCGVLSAWDRWNPGD